MSKILKQIEEEFKLLHDLYGELPIRDINTVTSKDLEKDLEIYGMFNIENAITEECFKKNTERIFDELYFHLFGNQEIKDNELYEQELKRIKSKYPNMKENLQKIATLTIWWNSKNGFGNSSFRFLFFQYTDNSPKFKIGNTNIEFSRNPFYRINIQLLSDIPKIWELLKGLYPHTNPMISWDSQKVRFQDTGIINKIGLSKTEKSTKPTITKRHNDVYFHEGKELDRVQAMLIKQSSNAISLGYVIFSHNKKIHELFSQYFNKSIKEGFSVIEDSELNKILDKYWRAPKEGFVIWKQHTVHYEAEATIDRKFKSTKQTIQNLREFSFRAVIGTHTPVELNTEELKQLAYLAEKGWQPEIYKNKKFNKGTSVYKNIVDFKSTQYLHPRKISEHENNILKETEKNYNNYDNYVKNLPKIIQEMYGIYN